MIEGRFGPFGTVMTGIALIAPMPIVSIIFEMARRARFVHLVVKRVLRMAIATLQCGVFALKWKFRIADVIKT